MPGPGEGIAEKLHLGGTADERSAAALSRIGADPRARADGLPGEDRLRLALGAYRLECQVLDRARGREVRCLADEDAVDGRGLLQARCDVDEVRDDAARPRPGRTSGLKSASPVDTPTLTASCAPSAVSARSAIASRILSAARTARSGSSSWATGAPKTAITASPMNFSTVPPRCSTFQRSRAWNGSSSRRTSSGSSRSASVVKPTRSAKSTVTVRRSAEASTPPGLRQAQRHRRRRSGSLPGSRRRSSGRRARSERIAARALYPSRRVAASRAAIPLGMGAPTRPPSGCGRWSRIRTASTSRRAHRGSGSAGAEPSPSGRRTLRVRCSDGRSTTRRSPSSGCVQSGSASFAATGRGRSHSSVSCSSSTRATEAAGSRTTSGPSRVAQPAGSRFP